MSESRDIQPTWQGAHHLALVTRDAGIPVTELMEQGPIRQFLLTDNNGIMIEVNWAPYDFITQPIDYNNSNMFNDPDPVPAVQEIMHDGRLRQS